MMSHRLTNQQRNAFLPRDKGSPEYKILQTKKNLTYAVTLSNLKETKKILLCHQFHEKQTIVLYRPITKW